MKNILTILLVLSSLTGFCQTPNLSTELVWAQRISETEYEIKSKADKDLKISQGTSPNSIQWSKAVKLKKGGSLKVANPEAKRLYFATVTGKDTLVFSERRLLMTHSPNFRDLGGIKTKDGKTLHWNKIFRCGDMGYLSEADLEYIRSLKINTVVDFRSEDEITKSPDKYPAGAEVKRVHTIIGASNPVKSDGLMKALYNPTITKETMDSVFTQYYVNAVGSVVDYKPLFDELVSGAKDEALLFHCSAGKDRTGVASALILYALGVPEETITEEYYLSNLYTKNILDNSDRFKGVNPEALKVLAGVQPHYIKATFSEIKKQYGSIDNILEKELGIDKAKRQLLIAKYTY